MSEQKRDRTSIFVSGITILATATFFRLLLARVPVYSLQLNVLWPLLPFVLATILGGLVALRFHELSLVELIRVVVVLFIVVATYTAAQIEGDLSLLDRLTQLLVYLVGASGGVFLLPFIYPAARRNLSTRVFKRIGIVLVILLVLVIAADLALSRTQSGQPGLITLTLGTLVAAIGIGLGLILSFTKHHEHSVFAGGVGISLFLGCYIVWVSFGSPWFP